MKINFLVFSYKIPSEPSKNRVYIWRSMKNLGAVYLQQGVALFPQKEDILTKLKKLNDKVKSFEGAKSTLSELSFLSKEDEDSIINKFNSQSINEYTEFIKNCKNTIYELDRESEENNYDFLEFEEAEEDIKKLELWIKKIYKRDYFNCGMYDEALSYLEKTKLRVKDYGDNVFKADPNKA